MPAIITKGAFSAQGYGFGASAATGATYIEDVFSTYLYTGNGTSQTITNGIDLSTKGGMVWIKDRTTTWGHYLFDTARGASNALQSNTTGANQSTYNGVSAFTSTGFSLGAENGTNISTDNFASWTFRKQPKFFDVVTYTGTGSATTIAHNLGSVPGMIIVKRTNAGANWAVYHNSLTSASYYLSLNTTTVQTSDTTVWNGTAPTSSVFSVGTSTLTNTSGSTYVAYIYAHNAGGFGAAGTDSVVACGSWSGGNTSVNLGWEPQFVLVKNASVSTGTVGNWFIVDNMRGLSQTSAPELRPNLSNAEDVYWNGILVPTATGFDITATITSGTYIYMAIRRGPMKTPTDATKVFSPITTTSLVSTQQTTGFPIDTMLFASRGVGAIRDADRLRGVNTVVTTLTNSPTLATYDTTAESSAAAWTNNWNNTGFAIPDNFNNTSSIFWSFRRAPGFFDEVCYSGTGTATNFNHNLTVVPELIIFKCRNNSTYNWAVYSAPTGADKTLYLNLTDALLNGGPVCPTTPTATTFPLPGVATTNGSGLNYVAYLFATLAGVSKVGSYTGTGAAQNIDCGFAASARFILIKRTDSTGSWYVYDSARGISASNDPYLLLNSAAAEVTNTNYVGTYASGFALTSTAPAALNANGGSFIFLAVA